MRLGNLIATVLACISSAGGAAYADDDGFMAYWAKFRAAVPRHDMTTLETMSRFPLEVTPDADQDHPQHISKAQFPVFLGTQLKCDALKPGSTFNMFKARVKLDTPNDYHRSSDATVDRFSFGKKAGQWRLTSIAYGVVEEYERRLKGQCGY